jgi:hypothetical protein
MTALHAPALAYNTLIVAVGVAAVGFAAGVVGSLSLLRKRPLVGDAAAHATLVGVAAAFLATGRRDLPTLLAGAPGPPSWLPCGSGTGPPRGRWCRTTARATAARPPSPSWPDPCRRE